MILIPLIILFVIFIQIDLINVIQIILLLITFKISNFLITINPVSRVLHIVRIISILCVIWILYDNTSTNHLMASILPLSVDKISFLDEYDSPKILSDDLKREYIYICEKGAISNFLKDLDSNKNYVVHATFIVDKDFADVEDNMPQLFLSKPFLVNKFSSYELLNIFLNEQLLLMIDLYNLDDSLLDCTGYNPIIIFNYWEVII